MGMFLPLKIEHFRENIIASLVARVARLLLGSGSTGFPWIGSRFGNCRDRGVAFLLVRPEVLVWIDAMSEEGSCGASVEVSRSARQR